MTNLLRHIALHNLIYTIEIQSILLVNRFWEWKDNLEKLKKTWLFLLSNCGWYVVVCFQKKVEKSGQTMVGTLKAVKASV